jgi:hypothetical protein
LLSVYICAILSVQGAGTPEYQRKETQKMDELRQKIYDQLAHSKMYYFSSDASVKALESDAVKVLEADGYIVIRMRTIGYVIADVL